MVLPPGETDDITRLPVLRPNLCGAWDQCLAGQQARRWHGSVGCHGARIAAGKYIEVWVWQCVHGRIQGAFVRRRSKWPQWAP